MHKVVYQVHPQFKGWLFDQLQLASRYMINRTTINLTSNEIFEALVPVEHQTILRQASVLLKKVYHQSCTVEMRSIKLHIDINNPNLMDEIIFPFRLNSIDGKLLEYLTPSLQLARDWATLQYVTKYLIELTNDRYMLANLFPWLPDVVRESGWILIPDENAREVSFERSIKRRNWYKGEVGLTTMAERYACDRTFIAALKRKTPAPAMTESVREAVALGSKLFTQYRLAKQNEIAKPTNSDRQSTITPMITNDLIDPGIIKGLEETKQIYEHERWAK